MPNYTAITKQDHLDSSYKAYSNYNHAKSDTVAPLLYAELSEALAYYPIGFIKNQEQRYQLVAIQSLSSNINIYVNKQGQYLAPYVPSHYRAHPFRLLPNTAKDNELTLCFDKDANLVTDTKEEGNIEFFTQDGELSEKLKSVLSFLNQCETNRQVTQTIVDLLETHKLIQKWSINLETQVVGEDKTPKEVEGLYKIDEEALRALEPEVLSILAKSGALALAYGQLLSQARLKDFSKRYEYHTMQEAQSQAQATKELDLDRFFSESDTISF